MSSLTRQKTPKWRHIFGRLRFYCGRLRCVFRRVTFTISRRYDFLGDRVVFVGVRVMFLGAALCFWAMHVEMCRKRSKSHQKLVNTSKTCKHIEQLHTGKHIGNTQIARKLPLNGLVS